MLRVQLASVRGHSSSVLFLTTPLLNRVSSFMGKQFSMSALYTNIELDNGLDTGISTPVARITVT